MSCSFMYTNLNILVGKNSATGLSEKATIQEYLYSLAHESITIEIQITYDIDGDTNSTNDTLTTILKLTFVKT